MCCPAVCVPLRVTAALLCLPARCPCAAAPLSAPPSGASTDIRYKRPIREVYLNEAFVLLSIEAETARAILDPISLAILSLMGMGGVYYVDTEMSERGHGHIWQ